MEIFLVDIVKDSTPPTHVPNHAIFFIFVPSPVVRSFYNISISLARWFYYVGEHKHNDTTIHR